MLCHVRLNGNLKADIGNRPIGDGRSKIGRLNLGIAAPMASPPLRLQIAGFRLRVYLLAVTDQAIAKFRLQIADVAECISMRSLE